MDSGAPERRNVPIRRIQTTLQGMGVETYTNLLDLQTAILNHEAHCRWKLSVKRLPDNFDFAVEYFTTYPCQCCDEDTEEEASSSASCGDTSEGDLCLSDSSSGLSDSELPAVGMDEYGEAVTRTDVRRPDSELYEDGSEDSSVPHSEDCSSTSGGEESASDLEGD